MMQLIKLQDKFTWILIKAIFNYKTKFKTILKSKSLAEIQEFKTKAIFEENYELAAMLEYYIKFKFKEHESV